MERKSLLRVGAASGRGAARLLLALWLPVCLGAAQKPPKNPPPARANKAAKQAARSAQQELNAPMLTRLSKMSPEQREAALSRLAPARRLRIERQLENFASKTPEQQARALTRQQRLMALPPERRQQARQSLRELLDTPPPRRGAIAVELQRLSKMTDEERAERMNSRAFRERYSAAEIEMMDNLRGLVP